MPIRHSYDFLVQWHLTERCNLRCRHCYQTGADTGEMSFHEIRAAADEISETVQEWKETYGIDFSTDCNVTGGEPFLRSDLLDILSLMKDKGFVLYLLTNGILVNEKKAKALSRLGVKGVQVSIEGKEETHDSIRGNGSFAASLEGVRRLLEADLRVTLNITLSAFNAGEFEHLAELSSDIGVQRLGFSRLVPSGRAAAMIDGMLDTASVKDLYKKIYALKTNGLEIVTGDPVASQLAQGGVAGDCGDIPSGGCAAGVSGLTILPDGTLLPCRRLHIPIGNIKSDSFREIWATSEVLESLRDRNSYKGRCRECSRWANCRGCRAIAFAYSRARGSDDFLCEDPQCFI